MDRSFDGLIMDRWGDDGGLMMEVCRVVLSSDGCRVMVVDGLMSMDVLGFGYESAMAMMVIKKKAVAVVVERRR